MLMRRVALFYRLASQGWCKLTGQSSVKMNSELVSGSRYWPGWIPANGLAVAIAAVKAASAVNVGGTTECKLRP